MNNNNNNNLVKQKKIFEDEIELDIAIYFIAICIIGIIIYNKCYTNYIAECKGYIFNNYLYMIISILIMLFFISIMDYNNANVLSVNNMIFLALTSMLLYIISRIIMSFLINPSNVAINHIVWIIGLFSISIFIYIVSNFSKGNFRNANIIIRATDSLYTLGYFSIIIIGIIGLLINYISILQIVNWNAILASILGLFVFSILFGIIFISSSNDFQKYIKYMIILSYILFICLVIANHIDLINNAKTCKTPNYPLESYNFVIKIRRLFIEYFINLFR